MIVSEEVIRSLLSELKRDVSWEVGNILSKPPKIFITIIIEKSDTNVISSIKESIYSILKSHISGENLQLIFTNKPETSNGSKPKHYIEAVKKIIVVASGKGGVGKSTMSVAIAEKLVKDGKRVGIVDADIYGPSIPTMLGLHNRPEIIDKKLVPLIARNIQVISIGFVVDQNSAIAWRGPMATKALYQLLSSVKWDNVDYLIIDMPPGTGDIHLSLLENYNIDGGVYIVTTPQLVSMSDAERAISLYKKFGVEIKAIIENMSYLIDESGNKIQVFSGNAGQILSKKYNIPLLVQIPIIPEISYNTDNALPISDLIQDLNILNLS